VNSPRSPSTWAAATAMSTASSAVMSRLATPRTPSVPNRRAMRGMLPLGVLGRAAGLLEAGLLALDDTRVAGEVAGLLEGGSVGLLVDLVERAGDPEPQGARLARGAAAVDAGVHVELALEAERR